MKQKPGRLLYATFYNIDVCRKHPSALFIYGDNLVHVGTGGTACIRREPNSLGVPTKKVPAMHDLAYFTDDDFQQVSHHIDRAFGKAREQLEAGGDVVLPAGGLGTGRAGLAHRAPRIFAHITDHVTVLRKIASSVYALAA
ncbi:DUF7831 domain-containing protein [Roseococcus pinisoli]|uniref:DUF7831 domain-containing protein n=1 Tax=Roseococcus pinisoli TaxID=2835040 RepID=A0ABS5QIL5_9PROT|nr:hypothetical protein [Roseococcus pinisoli]MBS7812388.1 hypothetical protein [Roseococcus pinisoli]